MSIKEAGINSGLFYFKPSSFTDQNGKPTYLKHFREN